MMAATRIQNTVVRRLVIGLCFLAWLSVAYARLYRGAHHTTDILGGVFNGLACALLAWNYLRRSPEGARNGTRAPSAPARPLRPARSGRARRSRSEGREARRDQGQKERPERLLVERLQCAVEALGLLRVRPPRGDEEEEADDQQRHALGDVADPTGVDRPAARVLTQVAEELLRPALVDVVAGDAEDDQTHETHEEAAPGFSMRVAVKSSVCCSLD